MIEDFHTLSIVIHMSKTFKDSTVVCIEKGNPTLVFTMLLYTGIHNLFIMDHSVTKTVLMNVTVKHTT